MHLLIPAAGVGKRMGAEGNKLRLSLLGKPLLAWTLMAAAAAKTVEWIGLIGQPVDWPIWEEWLQVLQLQTPVTLIEGGSTRQESVYCGLQALPPEATRVLIHDGARCLATPALFNRCAEALMKHEGLIAAIPVKDTIKVVNEQGEITATPNREQLWAAQTPQGFQVAKLKNCHEMGRQQGWSVTDDAALFERFDLPVQIVMGEETNLKITTPADLTLATLILEQRQVTYSRP
ncbi:2-C-methyl-D-erythritol 4-phosphate cytidylyltransferase [Synechococcales cyanobacterium C]|uniref:2-C-methyl-D-erythritol 4-phosphate cytidylyltransferase n=1 Tax=Petrachloros mirabilis ULC683 TaxID=2781853 RepID=A0A8K1ZWD7_9CYAN|nr:2-C-methyl-D-erythritol 4-phosphate cytidylyltransferase [Petrachloros mirabilis]NCJ05291.1 2-C-methyl-D-erythritol 4-phosphate cytidylyltransferase [Petrachloros mirabilis ULC683]